MKAVQSAMAIRRQRRRRDEAFRAKARRSSHQSDLLMLSDSLGGSQLSLDGLKSRSARQRQMSGVTAFHVGIVFFLLGLMLVISGIVPNYANQRQQQYPEPNHEWNGKNRAPLLLSTGSFLVFIGIALIVANRIATRKEDEQFTRYIASKLAKSRHAHQPMSSSHSSHERYLAADHKNKRSPEDGGQTVDVMLNDNLPQSQSLNQLESIIEDEAEGAGSERASKDRLYWTNEVAPVHNTKHDGDRQSRSGCPTDGLINEEDAAGLTTG